MEHIEKLYDLKDMILAEMEEIANHGSISTSSELQKIDTLAHAAKNIDKLIMAAEFTESGYSRNDGYYARGYSRRGLSHDVDENGYSARRNRDSQGRYSRAEGKADAVERLERMMHETEDAHERDVYRQALEQLRGR